MNLTKLDNVFSKYIRLRDRIDNTDYCKCISCGKLIEWKQADAGHYICRKHLSLRYNEQNVHAQCRACNRFDGGNMAGYTISLQKKYGEDIVQRLLLGKHQTIKFSKFEIETMVRYYKNLVDNL